MLHSALSTMRSLSLCCSSAALFLSANLLHAQSAQEVAAKACALESQQQQGAALWSTRTIKRIEGHVYEYRRIETVDGDVQRLIRVDGHMPDGPEKIKNDEVLHALLTDPSARRKAADTERTGTARTIQTLALVPAMFLFKDKSNDGAVRVLSFTPNPSYKPKTYEERAIHSLAGDLKLDVQTTRIESIDAIVAEPVKFGLGLLGSLSQGGTIHLQFAQVGPGIWKTQKVKLNIDGHIALVKSMAKTEDAERLDFERLPNDLTILRALDMLHVTQ